MRQKNSFQTRTLSAPCPPLKFIEHITLAASRIITYIEISRVHSFFLFFFCCSHKSSTGAPRRARHRLHVRRRSQWGLRAATAGGPVVEEEEKPPRTPPSPHFAPLEPCCVPARSPFEMGSRLMAGTVCSDPSKCLPSAGLSQDEVRAAFVLHATRCRMGRRRHRHHIASPSLDACSEEAPSVCMHAALLHGCCMDATPPCQNTALHCRP